MSSSKKRPALFRALGRQEPPESIEVDGKVWTREEIFKHDSWAATCVYRHNNERIICKLNRRQSIFGFPMRWLGWRLASRERSFLSLLAETGHVPKPLGPVTIQGRVWKTAVARPYLPGHPLSRNEKINDSFLPQLRQIILEMHNRGMAYVDLHKKENVLVGEDGEPYLIDFQVCLRFPKWLLWCCPLFWLLLRAFQRADLYHFQKHVKHLRPDQYESLASGRAYQRPNWIKIHRLVAVPLRELRRKLLTLLKIRSGKGRSHSELEPEIAVRLQLPQQENDNQAA